MAQTIKLKRSATQGTAPSTGQLELGEVAINTYDGKMYIKKDNGTQSIVEIGAADPTTLVSQDSPTGAAILPIGTEAQRPSAPVAGMIRFNSDVSRFEGYNGVEWVYLQTEAIPSSTLEGDLQLLEGTEDLQEGSGSVDLNSTEDEDLSTLTGLEDLLVSSGTLDLQS